uniref:AAA ATPase domain-containing protein n=1 Tax=Candidatus Kentrum sp. FW TaxID=2126338 RepID=A0A450TTA1_9GAMM|nr:MAG: AAA ATPase domain-containing protein [Candidatus Kentron sp. FW]
MLQKIKITGLFDQFDYEIELKPEGITILTGPNGYGKTTILKAIYAFTQRNILFLLDLPFSEIVLLHSGEEISVAKESSFSLPTKWHRDLLSTYFIQEQRLFKRKPGEIANKPPSDGSDLAGEVKGVLEHSIEEYASELSSRHMKNALAEASKISQELDGSFPERLFQESGSIDEQEFNRRYETVRQRQNALSRYGLSTAREGQQASFKEENARALLVYLDDTEKKLAVFDEILERLDLFSSILDKKQFANKAIEISLEFGFRFKTDDGKELPLTALSSGEQQEVVLLYELLFKVEPGALVLIDEPETSLHVAWQREFLDDLSRIVASRGIQVLLATHSPQIIGTHWDWVVDLWENSGHE